jgi:hypothetical protein
MSSNSNNSNIPSQKQERIRGKAENTIIDNPERWALMKTQFDIDSNEREFESFE